MSAITCAPALGRWCCAAVARWERPRCATSAALALPLAAAAAVALLQRPPDGRPRVGLMVVCEGRSDDLSASPAACTTRSRSAQPRRGPARDRRPGGAAAPAQRRAPAAPGRPAHPAAALVVLATAAGAVTGHFAGIGTEILIFAARQLAWLVVVPLLVVNVVETEREVRIALAFAAVLAPAEGDPGRGRRGRRGRRGGGRLDDHLLRADRQLAGAAGHPGRAGGAAAARAAARSGCWRARCWCCRSLSFRRSFWIGAALGVLLVILLGSRPAGRRIVVVAGMPLGLARGCSRSSRCRQRRRSSSAPSRSSRRRSSRTPRTATASTSSRT